ncbi:MAG TPA: glycosyltransferase [Polyangiaceae bacterium]
MNNPGISVIIPCFNMGRFLAEAVESVHAQRHEPLEIIVVDDGSSDDSAEHAKRLLGDVRYLWQENQGPGAARNHGLRAARHEIVAFLDADDLWPADKTSVELAHLESDPELDFVVGNQRHFARKPGAPEGSREYEFEEPYFIFLFGCGLFRRRVFDKVGVCDESMRYSEDTDWFFRCREAGVPYKVIPEVTVFYRRHESSMTHGRDAVAKGFLSAIKKSLDRRRTIGQRDLPWLYGSLYSKKTEPERGER